MDKLDKFLELLNNQINLQVNTNKVLKQIRFLIFVFMLLIILLFICLVWIFSWN